MNAVSKPTMSLVDAIFQRRSVRGFLPKTVPEETMRNVFEQAQQAPSNCNTQPWYTVVASGDLRNSLRDQFVGRAMAGAPSEPDFSYVSKFEGVYRGRQVDCAAALYGEMEIARDDKAGRSRAALRNFEFFDAPHVAFLCMDRSFGATIAVDVGIYAQTLMLAMTAQGISSCAMGSLRSHPDLVRAAFGLEENIGVVFGICFGYDDSEVKANNTRTTRVSLDETVVFKDR
ncbi:nitroreductase [Marinobacter psychrophilus]|jgi:nitroreductase|uniref:nitroreductase n=1 Tax=Marinobacter psychrophilus TaxID=330734 RepID=UPI001B6C0349|nr:nitroreductase [Marinobacter psychrophilus]MBQ0762390.1 nitroreductase [Marinobacter psychrophilus]MBQ0844756.1 nitroreductase [Marinobacter psychrophilus]